VRLFLTKKSFCTRDCGGNTYIKCQRGQDRSRRHVPLKRQGARFELHIEKGRSLFGKDATPFEAQLSVDAHGKPVWALKDLEAARGKQITELAALGMRPAEIAQELGMGRATVYRHLKSAGSSEANGHA